MKIETIKTNKTTTIIKREIPSVIFWLILFFLKTCSSKYLIVSSSHFLLSIFELYVKTEDLGFNLLKFGALFKGSPPEIGVNAIGIAVVLLKSLICVKVAFICLANLFLFILLFFSFILPIIFIILLFFSFSFIKSTNNL